MEAQLQAVALPHQARQTQQLLLLDQTPLHQCDLQHMRGCQSHLLGVDR